MTRPLRIEYAGAIYHITSRGDRREDIVLDDEDRYLWLEMLSQVCSRFNWRCHAWCLMDNHYHIVIETIEGNLSQGMRQLNGVFTQKSNRRHGRVGHVYQGRFKAILVQKEAYLLELARYVVLNPIRARMVSDMADWKWSSYPAMIGEASATDWLEKDWILSYFGKSRLSAILNYKNFVREGIGLPSIYQGIKGKAIMGDEKFVEDALTKIKTDAKAGDLKEVPQMQRRAQAKPLSWYKDNFLSRDEGIVNAYRSGDYTMKLIADKFKIHYSTVSRSIKKVEMHDCKT